MPAGSVESWLRSSSSHSRARSPAKVPASRPVSALRSSRIVPQGGQAGEHVPGQRREGVVGQRDLLDVGEPREHAGRQRGESVVVQDDAPEQDQPGEVARLERRDVLAGHGKPGDLDEIVDGDIAAIGSVRRPRDGVAYLRRAVADAGRPVVRRQVREGGRAVPGRVADRVRAGHVAHRRRLAERHRRSQGQFDGRAAHGHAVDRPRAAGHRHLEVRGGRRRVAVQRLAEGERQALVEHLDPAQGRHDTVDLVAGAGMGVVGQDRVHGIPPLADAAAVERQPVGGNGRAVPVLVRSGDGMAEDRFGGLGARRVTGLPRPVADHQGHRRGPGHRHVLAERQRDLDGVAELVGGIGTRVGRERHARDRRPGGRRGSAAGGRPAAVAFVVDRLDLHLVAGVLHQAGNPPRGCVEDTGPGSESAAVGDAVAQPVAGDRRTAAVGRRAPLGVERMGHVLANVQRRRCRGGGRFGFVVDVDAHGDVDAGAVLVFGSDRDVERGGGLVIVAGAGAREQLAGASVNDELAAVRAADPVRQPVVVGVRRLHRSADVHAGARVLGELPCRPRLAERRLPVRVGRAAARRRPAARAFVVVRAHLHFVSRFRRQAFDGGFGIGRRCEAEPVRRPLDLVAVVVVLDLGPGVLGRRPARREARRRSGRHHRRRRRAGRLLQIGDGDRDIDARAAALAVRHRHRHVVAVLLLVVVRDVRAGRELPGVGIEREARRVGAFQGVGQRAAVGVRRADRSADVPVRGRVLRHLAGRCRRLVERRLAVGEGRAGARVRPGARPFVVPRAHLHLVLGRRVQVRERRGQFRAVVRRADEAADLLLPVLHVVVFDGRPRVRGRLPGHFQRGGRGGLPDRGRGGRFRRLAAHIGDAHGHRDGRATALIVGRPRRDLVVRPLLVVVVDVRPGPQLAAGLDDGETARVRALQPVAEVPAVDVRRAQRRADVRLRGGVLPELANGARPFGERRRPVELGPADDRRRPGPRAFVIRRPHPHLVVRRRVQARDRGARGGAGVVPVDERAPAIDPPVHVVVVDHGPAGVLGRRPGDVQAAARRGRHGRRQRSPGRFGDIHHRDRHVDGRAAAMAVVGGHGQGVAVPRFVIVPDVQSGGELTRVRLDAEQRRVRPAQAVAQRIAVRVVRPHRRAELLAGSRVLAQKASRRRFEERGRLVRGSRSASRQRPAAGPLRVVRPHLRLVGGVRAQVRERRGEPPAVVSRVGELVFARDTIAYVVVRDAGPAVLRARPRDPEARRRERRNGRRRRRLEPRVEHRHRDGLLRLPRPAAGAAGHRYPDDVGVVARIVRRVRAFDVCRPLVVRAPDEGQDAAVDDLEPRRVGAAGDRVADDAVGAVGIVRGQRRHRYRVLGHREARRAGEHRRPVGSGRAPAAAATPAAAAAAATAAAAAAGGASAAPRGPGARALGVRRPHPHLVVRTAPQTGNPCRGAGTGVVRVDEVRAEGAVLHVVVLDRRSRVPGRRPGHRQARRGSRRHARRRRRGGRLVDVEDRDRHGDPRGAPAAAGRRHGHGVRRAPFVIVGHACPGAQLPARGVDAERRRVRPAERVARRVRRPQGRPDGDARSRVLRDLAPGAVALHECRTRRSGRAAGFRPVAGAALAARAHAHLVRGVLDESGDHGAGGGALVAPVGVLAGVRGAVLHVVVDDVVRVLRRRPGRRQAGGGEGGDHRRRRRRGTESPPPLQEPQHDFEPGAGVVGIGVVRPRGRRLRRDRAEDGDTEREQCSDD